jgi:hypothetical protein
MKRFTLFIVTCMLAILAACTTLGVDAPQTFNQRAAAPQTFNQRAAAAQITVTAVRSQALTLLMADKISAADAKNVQASADAGNAAIDLALLTAAADPTGAGSKLTSAITILTGVQAYLASKGAK